MAVTINDIGDAVHNYPASSVVLSIVDVVVQTGTGPNINVGETWAFQVRVANNGDLNMTGVTLHVEGENGVTVSTAAAGPFSTSIFPALTAVNAHSTQDTGNLYFKPGLVKPANTALVRAHISTFDSNFDYVLNGRSDHADPPSGTYTHQVFPA
jgi:hypothetical protein